MDDDITEIVETIQNYTKDLAEGNSYLMQRITDFYKTYKIDISFNYCHIAISKNGGLIAVCKKKGYLDTSKSRKLNDNIIVMFQNANPLYYINIDWNFNKRWIVCLDFTIKQELYGILNDGGIFKFKYKEKIKKEKVTSKILKEEGIEDAKFFEKGFIAYTRLERFYYIKDIKDPVPILLCEKGMLGSIKNINFLAISSENTKSKKIELLILNEKGNGVIHIEQQLEGQNFQVNIIDEKKTEIIGVNLILKGELQPFLLNNLDNNLNKDDKRKMEGDYPEGFGKITAMAISPSGKNIAFYNSKDRVAFIMNSQFNGKYSKVFFKFQEGEYSAKQKDELKAILEFGKGCNFLFCGEDAVAITGQRFIIISSPDAKQSITYLIKEGSEISAMYGTSFCKCISEVDGLRCLAEDGVYLITKVSKQLNDISWQFSQANSKNFLKIYNNSLSANYNSHKDMQFLQNLEDIVCDLQLASADIFWTEEENENHFKEVQLIILKASQYGKYFVNKDNFNFDRYNTICKDMRIINQLRNDKYYPMFITYREYIELNHTDIIDILIQYKNYKSAAQISKYLEYDTKKIMYKYMIEKMRRDLKLADKFRFSANKSKENTIEEEAIYQDLLKEIEKLTDISYVKLAKKAIQFGSEVFAMKLLEQEKSALTKIPQLLELNKLINSLNICFETYNFNIVSIVFNKILYNKLNTKSENEKIFFEIICKPELQNHRSKIILYLKKYKPEKLEEFLLKTKSYDELLYIKLRKIYKSQESKEKFALIKEIKADIKNYDPKFNKYIKILENSIQYKKSCINENIIHYSEIQPYSKTVYDSFLEGCKKGKYDWIEGQNKNLEYSNKKINIIKFRAYLEMNKPDAIDSQLEKTSLKKLGLTPLNMAEIYYDYKFYDKALDYLKQIKDKQNNYDYIIEFLMVMNKNEEALELIISDKNVEDKESFIKQILKNKPNLKNYVNELCVKYKVSLS